MTAGPRHVHAVHEIPMYDYYERQDFVLLLMI